MRFRKGEKLESELLAAYLEGEVPASELPELEQALHDDAGAQRRLEQLRHVQSALSAPVPELDRIDLTARVRAAVAHPERSMGRRGTWMALGAGLAAAASLLVFFSFGVAPHEASEFRAKSAGGATPESQRWAGVSLHRALPGGRLEALPEAMTAHEGLVVSYTNVGPHPYRYLMVFAIDARHEVRWFYPAYEQAGSDPLSVPIAARADVSMAEVIEHDYAPGLLTVHALFSNEPWRVSQVEAWVASHAGRFEGAALADAGLETMHVRVTP